MKTGSFYSLGICGLPTLLSLAAFTVLPQLASPRAASNSAWFVDPAGKSGAFRRDTTREDLVRVYGADNVKDDEMGIGEGETIPATIIFPGDPDKEIAIAWQDGGMKSVPARIQISGTKSRWQTSFHVSLGTSLRTLEKLNKRPFQLAGFEWDYSGTVTSWQDGALQKLFETTNHEVILRLDRQSGAELPEDVLSQVAGDGVFPSSNPVMQRVNPRVYQLIWTFTEAKK